MRQAVWHIAIAAAAGLTLGTAAALMVTEEGLPWALMLGIPMAAGAFVWKRLVRFQQRCKTAALERLAGAIGMEYRCEGFEPEGVARLQALGLLPGYDRASFEDRFSGHRGGCDFRLYEARMEERRGAGKSRQWVTVFAGQVILIDFHRRFLGTTVVNRARFLGRAPRGLEPVRLESNAFEKVFDVYGTDQVEARYLVHPVFMERLTELESALGGQKLRCAFDGGDLMVMVEGGDLFEVVNVLERMPNRGTTRKGVDGIVRVLKLIDSILARPPNPYGADGS